MGGDEVRGGDAGLGELRFQPVRQGHPLLHFDHDPALLGEGRGRIEGQRPVAIPAWGNAPGTPRDSAKG